MFSQPVVFVVGAGASAEYNMPVGSELKTKIASAVGFLDADGRPSGDRDLYKLLVDRFGSSIEKYVGAGNALAKVIPSFDSIDEALNWFSSRPEVIELGKVAIVREILKSERGSLLFSTIDPRKIPGNDFSGTWLPYLLSMAMGSQKMDQVETAFNNLTIVNFNYDRTIEHFLYSQIQKNFDLAESNTKRVLSGLKIIRPYGTVGALEWQGDAALPFGAELGSDHDALFSASKNLRTYTEGTMLQMEIQDAMQRARMVVFLGFGFHPENMKLLRVRGAESWHRAMATVVRMDSENYPIMKAAISMVVGCLPPNDPQLLNWYAHRLMIEMKPALMATAVL